MIGIVGCDEGLDNVGDGEGVVGVGCHHGQVVGVIVAVAIGTVGFGALLLLLFVVYFDNACIFRVVAIDGWVVFRSFPHFVVGSV